MENEDTKRSFLNCAIPKLGILDTEMHFSKASDPEMRRLLSTIFPISIILTAVFMIKIEPAEQYSYQLNRAVSTGALILGLVGGYRFRHQVNKRTYFLDHIVWLSILATLFWQTALLLSCVGPFSLSLLGASLGSQIAGIRSKQLGKSRIERQ